jgi:hypothetical protein
MDHPFWYNYYEYFHQKFENCPNTEEFLEEKQFYYQNLQFYRKKFNLVYQDTNFIEFEKTFDNN